MVCVLEKLLNKVDVGHDHAAAAVALQAKLVHRVTVDVNVNYRVSQSSIAIVVTHPSVMPSSMSLR